jgi:lipopolysaccharide transport system ATP-binding protein
MRQQSTSISLHEVNVEFPIYNTRNRSLKNQFLKAMTGGQIGSDGSGRVIIQSLHNISLEINEGDRVAILGHNGSGKTTLLRTIAGVYRPSRGNISVSGKISSLIDIFLGIDYEGSGVENIYLRAAILGISAKEVKKKLNEIVEFSGLGQFIDLPVRTYSSGMNLRLAFSISTMLDPEILIMDEWLSVGDSEFLEKATSRLNELVDKCKILVLATHSEDLAHKLCNRIIRLEKGEIISES